MQHGGGSQMEEPSRPAKVTDCWRDIAIFLVRMINQRLQQLQQLGSYIAYDRLALSPSYEPHIIDNSGS